MQDTDKLESTVEPFYNQLERLGVLYEDGSLSSWFLRSARRQFGRQYFKELKLLMRAENRELKHSFKMQRKCDNAQHKQDKRLLRRRLKEKRAKERQRAKTKRQPQAN